MTNVSRLVFVLSVLVVAATVSGGTKPNILFITSDDLNNSLGCYGGPAKTPNLDNLAERGVRFDRAYCQYPLCGPSRASFLSGMRPNTIGVLTNGRTVRSKRKDVVTLPQLFRRNGYISARVGKLYHLGIPGQVGQPGPDDPESWDYTYDPRGAEFNTPGEEHDPTPDRSQGFRRVIGTSDGQEQADYQAADEAIRLLNQHKDKPFFLAVGFIRPHVPVIAPKKYFDLYDLDAIKLPDVPPNDRAAIPDAAFHHLPPDWGMSEADQREAKRAYYASTSFMEAQTGRVLDELERLGLSDKTIVVFLSDHGYLLGEHDAWQKMMLFDPVARVPLLMAGPGVNKGAAAGLVELIDIYPTLAELCGLETPAAVEGRSTKPLLDQPDQPFRDAAYTQLTRKQSSGRSVRSDRWRYIEWEGEGAGVELYDLLKDPRELTNLATDPGHTETVETMQSLLHKVLPPGSAKREQAATEAARRKPAQ